MHIKPIKKRILIAPCSYKGSIDAPALAQVIAREAERCGFDTISAPFADGGDDTVNCLKEALDAEIIRKDVTGPLGALVSASYLIDREDAVVELASASGIAHLKPEELDGLRAQTTGLGQLIKDAIERGLKNIYVTLGGSASTDGGAGCLAALGARFLDKQGNDIACGGMALLDLVKVDLTKLEKNIAGVQFYVVSDVTNPLTGEFGAAAVFGPQKGLRPEDVPVLDRALSNFADVLERTLGRDASLREMPGAGSAGGAGYGLSLLLKAPIISGFDWLFDKLSLAEKIDLCDFVVVAEGRLDSQSLSGKGVGRLIALAKSKGKKVIAMPAVTELTAASVGIDILAPTANQAVKAPAAIADVGKVAGLVFSQLNNN